jgi:hypothetical protein
MSWDLNCGDAMTRMETSADWASRGRTTAKVTSAELEK